MTSFKAYIQHFSYKAITTEDWKSFLYSYFDSEKEKLDQVDWDLWFNKPGLAPVKGKYDTSLQDVCTKVITRSNEVIDLKLLRNRSRGLQVNINI